MKHGKISTIFTSFFAFIFGAMGFILLLGEVEGGLPLFLIVKLAGVVLLYTSWVISFADRSIAKWLEELTREED